MLLKDVWLKVRVWRFKNWMLIRPGPESRPGAVWGTFAAAAATVVIGGLYLRTGFGYLFDFAFATVHGNHNMSDFSDPGYAYLGDVDVKSPIFLACPALRCR